MDTRFSPKDIEDKWYSTWEDAGAFQPAEKGKPYTIVIPPPNVTGALHMGHALNNTIQDVLIRWKRMEGYRALWQPGTDHAGIATQAVVEKQLAAQGTDKHALGREKFIDRVWEWKAQYGDRIVMQLKKLGCSCDWSRLRFTMDEGLSKAVREVFVRLYEDGLIYKGTRLINWCPALQTALADEEVESRETAGHFWNMRYPLVDDPSRYVVVSTTRPETMFGDTAVAVHPDDERYKDLLGKHVQLPTTGRTIPIIADEHADPEKGSGAVKITPAHDFNDFEVGQRHQLEQICVMDPHGIMNEHAGKYQGMNRFEARKKLVEDLKNDGLLDGIEDRMVPIPTCYRSGDVIEPYLMSQWFVKMKPLAEPALKVVAEGKTRFVPERYTKTYNAWLEPFRDWCISRQIWWGHQIPAWYAISETGGTRTKETPVFVAYSEEEARKKAEQAHGKDVVLEQDEDVLDTWFSSALWPFSTLGWPEKTKDLRTFYPTDVLVTSRDIIYFWVARMVFSGLKWLDQEPFHTVYIHGTILDDKGQRMSKSKGNGIDPLEMIDQYGADAVRFSLLTLTTEGQDIKLSPTRFEMGRNFANKLWNAARFAGPHIRDKKFSLPEELELTDQWILSRLNTVIKQVTEAMGAFRFSEACSALYHFTWNDFCSNYLEIRKKSLTGQSGDEAQAKAGAVFSEVLQSILALLHPYMPYITEEIREQMGWKDLLITSAWPQANESRIQPDVEKGYANVFSLVEAVRSVRGSYAIAPSVALDVAVSYDESDTRDFVLLNLEVLRNLEKIDKVDIGVDLNKPGFSATELIPGGKLFVPLEGRIDKQAEKKKLQKEKQKIEGYINGLEKKLSNDKFVQNAPPEIVESEKQKLASQKDRLKKLSQALADLEG